MLRNQPNSKNKESIKYKNFLLSPLFIFSLSISFVVIGLLIFSAIKANILKNYQIADSDKAGNKKNLIAPANAAEIYPEFICPCCGQPLNPDRICCGAMKERIDFIDEQVSAGFSQEEIMIMAVKEFGINSLAKPEVKEEIKNKLLAQAPQDSPRIVFAIDSLDLGEVSQAKGIVSAFFDFKNEGKSDLVINKLSTSCGCTSASIVYHDIEGPTFTMPGHGKKNPQNWSVSIAPGEKAQLKVYYDPNAHGKQKEKVLPITRTISVFSNDPVDFEKQIKIELNQIP